MRVVGSAGRAIVSAPPTSPAGAASRSGEAHATTRRVATLARMEKRMVRVRLVVNLTPGSLTGFRLTDDPERRRPRLAIGTSCRLLLREAVQRTQSPHQIDRVNAADFAIGETVGKDAE